MSGVPIVSDHETTTATTAGKASLWRVVRDQRKTILVAAGLSVATYWILGQLGEWRLAGCIVGGVALGLTTTWPPSTGCCASSPRVTSPRATGWPCPRSCACWCSTVVAVGIAVWFWPDGIGLLLGLAIFRLIALVMTTMPLLKELKNQ